MIEEDVFTYSALLRIFISSLVGLDGGIAAYFWIYNSLFTLLAVSIPLSLAALFVFISCAQNRAGQDYCPACGQPLPKPITRKVQ